MPHTAISPAEFSPQLEALGPFEHTPLLAVALSGGSDSMALCLLAERWASAHGGKIVALTVDHGLRAESLAEADQLGCWMSARGIEHHILRWEGEKPTHGLQAAARDARYALLTGWCREHAILHLLLGHHQQDQAETLLLRRENGSRSDGMAGMSALAERQGIRLLRPLLNFPKARLKATLQLAQWEWLEDASNHLPLYHRNRIRRTLTPNNIPELIAISKESGRGRQEKNRALARLLARHIILLREGYARCEKTVLADGLAPELLSRLITSLGHERYMPRMGDLTRLLQRMMQPDFTRATLGGCIIWCSERKNDGECFFIAREPAAIKEHGQCSSEQPCWWDRRFRLTLTSQEKKPYEVTALTPALWKNVCTVTPSLARISLPKQLLFTLPVLVGLEGAVAIPHIEWVRPGVSLHCDVQFRPAKPLAAAPFFCVK